MTAEAHGAVASFRSVWRHRRWRWLLGSVLVSLAGDFLYWVALVVHLSRSDDGPTWIAAALLARFLPAVVLGPIGGAFADRLDRRRTLVGLDLARGVLYVVMAAVVAVEGPNAILIGLLALAAAAGTFYRPALVAATPAIVPESDIAAANAAEEGLAQLAWFVGPALGALLVTVFDPSVVLAIDAATFVASAVMIARVGSVGGGRPADRRPDSADLHDDERREGVLSEVSDGLRALARDRGLISLTALTAAVLFAFGAEQVLYVFVATDRLDLGPEGVGYLMAAMGVGGIAAAPLAALSEPRSDGDRQALAVRLAARRLAVDSGTDAQRQIHGLVVVAPEQLRSKLRGKTTPEMLKICSRLRVDPRLDVATRETALALRGKGAAWPG